MKKKLSELPLRSGVGIVVLNKQNKVFVAKRIDNPKNFWQMPQGGVDEGENFLKTSLVGKGAGGYPTATSIISDIKRFINYSSKKGIFIKKYSQMLSAKFVSQSQRIRPYYLRMSVLNKVGVLKSIAQLFSQKSISIKSIIQLNTNNEKVVPIIIISDPVGIKNITQVVNNLKKTNFIKNEISVIRIEENIG